MPSERARSATEILAGLDAQEAHRRNYLDDMARRRQYNLAYQQARAYQTQVLNAGFQVQSVTKNVTRRVVERVPLDEWHDISLVQCGDEWFIKVAYTKIPCTNKAHAYKILNAIVEGG